MTLRDKVKIHYKNRFGMNPSTAQLDAIEADAESRMGEMTGKPVIESIMDEIENGVEGLPKRKNFGDASDY